jgi:hypothetical protein
MSNLMCKLFNVTIFTTFDQTGNYIQIDSCWHNILDYDTTDYHIDKSNKTLPLALA